MFQQSLAIGPSRIWVHCGIYPTGGRRDPCVVQCTTCPYTTTAPTWADAIRMCVAHDWHHNRTDPDDRGTV